MRVMGKVLLTTLVLSASIGINRLPAQGPPPDGFPPGAPNGVPNGDPANDPPSRAARLGLIQGDVTFQPGGVEDWVPATLNRPMTTGDRLWTEGGARAEVHLGSTAFRMNGRTNFTFLNLTDNIAQVQVSSGTLAVRVRRLDDQESIEIDTPQAAFSILRPGDYRIDVSEQGDSTIATVRGGDAEVTAGGRAFPLHPRDQVRVSEENGQPVFDRRDAPVGDGFDNWCMDRDRREDRSESARHVSRDMPGYAELDGNGVWREDEQYGWIWAPRVQVGWAPYHYGHWVWIEPWGWTWVDDAPWGYAPFHYGRWAFVGAAWVWVPGPVAVRPVYAPALVAWVGGRNFGVGISIGGPAVGWFPLGPREVWVPPYRYSPRYITQVNVTNTVIVNRTVITNVNVTNVTYVNRGVAGAVTAVSQGAMVSGRPVGAAAVAVPPAIAARAEVGTYAAVAPQREAVLGGAAPVRNAPPAAVMNRTFVARATPPPPPPSFAQRQTMLQSNPGRPLERGAVAQIQQSQPAPSRPTYRSAMPQQNAPQTQQGGGFGRQNGSFGQSGQPGQPANAQGGNPPAGTQGGGGGFGRPNNGQFGTRQNVPQASPQSSPQTGAPGGPQGSQGPITPRGSQNPNQTGGQNSGQTNENRGFGRENRGPFGAPQNSNPPSNTGAPQTQPRTPQNVERTVNPQGGGSQGGGSQGGGQPRRNEEKQQRREEKRDGKRDEKRDR